MIRNIKVNKGHTTGLVQIIGNETVKNSIKYMSGDVKFNGKIIGKLTEECLELNDTALNSSICSELIDVVLPIVESKYCYLTLINKAVIKDDKLKEARIDFDTRSKQWNNTTDSTNKKSTVKNSTNKKSTDTQISAKDLTMLNSSDNTTQPSNGVKSTV